MGSLYPTQLDTFMPWVDGVTDLVVQDLEDLFDAILQIETELGDAQEDTINRPWPVSGDFGTIMGRMFSLGDRSKLDGGYIGYEAFRYNNQRADWYDDSQRGSGTQFESQRYEGRNPGWLNELPVAFAALMHDIKGTDYSGGANNFARGRPWGLCAVYMDSKEVLWAGRDGWGARLNTSTKTDVGVGIILWGLRG
jgi:hypothetical protein